jgi:orotate phosphoribosyltransferase
MLVDPRGLTWRCGMLQSVNVLDLYKKTGAYLEGHFLLASGRHAPKFLQSTTVMQHPKHAEAFGQGIAALFADSDSPPSFVIGPAMGGIVLAHETAKALASKHPGCRALFAEKDGHGGMTIREAFTVQKGETFIAVEDVVTTGGSLMKAVHAAEKAGATCIGIGCIIDRGTAKLPEHLTFKALVKLEFTSYAPEDCPSCKEKIPLVKI